MPFPTVKDNNIDVRRLQYALVGFQNTRARNVPWAASSSWRCSSAARFVTASIPTTKSNRPLLRKASTTGSEKSMRVPSKEAKANTALHRCASRNASRSTSPRYSIPPEVGSCSWKLYCNGSPPSVVDGWGRLCTCGACPLLAHPLAERVLYLWVRKAHRPDHGPPSGQRSSGPWGLAPSCPVAWRREARTHGRS